MSDAPLHTLCRICHMRAPQYTCPRCALRTCSLACVQTHKRRAPCSGLRDPTVYKPMRALATPAGVDHDYNFLSAIERSVARSEREIVEERGLVGKRELREGPPAERGGRGGGRGGRGGGEAGRGGEGEQKVRREALRVGVRIEKLPAGMARQKANGTSWSKKQKCVVWQVEWLREKEPAGEAASSNGTAALDTVHSKILATTPLLDAYTALLEEQRRAALTPEEKAREKKRRANEVAEGDAAKKTKLGDPLATAAEEGPPPDSRSSEVPDTEEPAAEDPAAEEPAAEEPAAEEPAAEEPAAEEPAAEEPTAEEPAAEQPQEQPQEQHPTDLLAALSRATSAAAAATPSPYAFYLHRPHTPVNQPVVLIPLRADLPLDAQLQGKVLVEFPTVYVFRARAGLPRGFMGVDEFFRRRGVGRVREDVESETSSSGSSSEEEEEEEVEEEDEHVAAAAQPPVQFQVQCAMTAPSPERGAEDAAAVATAAAAEEAHVE